MAWAINYTQTAQNQLEKLLRAVASRIMDYMDNRVAAAPNSPRDLGMAMRGAWVGHWRYRVGDYRLICELRDGKLMPIHSSVFTGHVSE